jgi:hypothetical protein
MAEQVTATTPAPGGSPSPTPAPAAAPSDASPSPNPAPSPSGESFIQTPAAAAPAPAPALTKPANLPDDLWDATSGVKSDRIKELVEFESREKALKGGLPKTAAEYKPDLPEGVKLPEGATIDVNDPRFKSLQEMAHAEGWSQKAFSKALGLELQRVTQTRENLAAAIKARNDALGPNGPARVDAIVAFVKTVAPDDKAAGEMAKMLVTPGIITTLERIQTALGSQGIASLSRAPVTPAPDPSKIEGYENMSFAERYVAGEARRQQQSPR